MNASAGEAEKTVRACLDAYFVRRDSEAVVSHLTEDVRWVGLGTGNILRNRQEVADAVKSEMFLSPAPHALETRLFQETPVSRDLSVVMGEARVRRTVPPYPVVVQKISLSATCIRTDQGWKIAVAHLSTPGAQPDAALGAALATAEAEADRHACLPISNEQGGPQGPRTMEREKPREQNPDVTPKDIPICEFYYYPKTRICVVPERTSTEFHCGGRYERMPESFMNAYIVPEYRADYKKMYEAIHQGFRTAHAEVLTVTNRWNRFVLTTVSYDAAGAPEFVVGIVQDNTEEKGLVSALEDARSRDPLTGLWNIEAGTRLAQEYMLHKPKDEHCVLMLLDMDDFAKVNDEEGVAFANAILQEVADILRTTTSGDDIQIRLGGDEFMLFIKHCDKRRATVIGPSIAEQVGNLLPQPDKSAHIAVSIGMCSTEVVNEYSGLYCCAESTLKYVKERWRGHAACYLDTCNELGEMLTNLYTEKHLVNIIEQESAERGEDLISFALDLLGKAKNLEDAVSLLFARVGKIYHLDRVSLLEIDTAFLTSRFTYQWARDKTHICLNKHFYLTREWHENTAARYDAEGLCEGLDDKAISPFSACLHTAVWNRGAFVGLLGFESDQEKYSWTKEQRRVLAELGKIVPSFVMKARADAVSQAKTDFLSRMSHEIRTPLNAIVGMTAIARSVADNKEKVLECLDKLGTANQHLLSLVNDILDMSRIESGKMELNPDNLSLASFLASLEGTMSSQAEAKGVFFVIENLYASDRPIMADRLRIGQVLFNIVGNAVKFTDSGGRVVLRVAPLEEKENSVTLHFSVTDTGIGISPEALEKIFNAFEQASCTTASRYGGTGLGLAISSRLVQMMGGSLEVVSEPGRGSSFFFTLTVPCGKEQTACDQAALSPQSYDFSGKRLLVVEDNELNREIAQTLLEMGGFLTETAENGQEALRRFAERPSFYYDAILMDIHMPVLDGLEATKQLRTMGRPDSRSVPIIAMTANAFNEDSQKSLQIGMNGHLSKPIQPDELFRMLQRCLRESKDYVNHAS